ncbi:MAG: hypothetical protein JEZ11_24430 [Desulfobacterales bacterium]|nr:hypothetical protein [Desulfobacterales bacterium]
MTRLDSNKPPRYRFDFEIGYLVKSPCRGCEERDHFPKCIDACKILDRIHTALAESVSCSRRK